MIPTNFDVLPANEEHSKTPVLVNKDEGYHVWFKKDDKFKKPKAIVSMKLYTKDCGLGCSKEGRLFASVWHKVQDEYLREFNYMADCAKLGFEVTILHDNINF